MSAAAPAPELSPLTRIVAFLRDIGLEVRPGAVVGKTFLPGIEIMDGVLVYDEAKLLYPGDLLHDAGHLAVMPAARRATIHIDVGNDGAEELMAIAWSYAAAVKIGLPPAVVFHEGGYKGGGQSLIEAFTGGAYPGLPMLQWCGLAADAQRAPALGVPPYPHMIRWLRA